MQDPENNDARGFDAVEDSVGKLRSDRAPHIAANLREHLRVAFDGVKGRSDGAEKPLTEALELFFVVREDARKVFPDPAAVDERQRH